MGGQYCCSYVGEIKDLLRIVYSTYTLSDVLHLLR